MATWFELVLHSAFCLLVVLFVCQLLLHPRMVAALKRDHESVWRQLEEPKPGFGSSAAATVAAVKFLLRRADVGAKEARGDVELVKKSRNRAIRHEKVQ